MKLLRENLQYLWVGSSRPIKSKLAPEPGRLLLSHQYYCRASK